jgi:hemerythrin-like metal-binding protein
MDATAPQPQSTVLMGYAPMDAVHAEFDQLVAAALAAPDELQHAALVKVHEHLLSHFGQEDAWMRENGFPAADCHIDEHAAVLRSADEVLPLVAQGRHDIGRSFLAELQRWFPGHADYLDSALAAWLCKRQYGGRPVAIHRRNESRPA